MEQTNNKHEVTPELLRLMNQAIADTRGSKAAFSRQIGISPYNLSKILSGNRKYVFGDIWSRICDFFPEVDDRPAATASVQYRTADPLLQLVFDAWPMLDAEERGRIAGIVTGLAEQKKARPAAAGGVH